MNPYQVLRGSERGRLSAGWLEARFSFNFGSYYRQDRPHFSSLCVLNEDWVKPETGFEMHPHADLEILMIPLSGRMEHADSLGVEETILPDDVMYMSAGSGIFHSQMNPSRQEVDHHLQIWLLPRTKGSAPRAKKVSFDRNERIGRWQLIAAGDGSTDVLQIDQDARVWRAQLPPGEKPLANNGASRASSYLHVIDGSVDVGTDERSEQLNGGDAIAWTISTPFTVRTLGHAPAELLLIDLPPIAQAKN